ncbi:MAG: protein translocase subunit SecF [Deltaproteobacteria bacterium]|nr:protein translocase subunit SecF [Deltaproteobacteria bacterium]MBW2306460.1 protein translocase subunit SecF [Deltaproteobacteria bacterium]
MQIIKPDINIDFMAIKKHALLFSCALILITIISLILHGGPNYGIDFTGGTIIQVKFKEPTNAAHIRSRVNIIDDTVLIQRFGSAENNEFLLRMAQSSPDLEGLSEKIRKALEQEFGQGNIEIRRVEMVGPKVGKDLQRKGIWAIIYALGGILFYIAWRFEFKYAIGAILALVHDVLITVGAFSLTNREISLAIIAAILTIIGYSLNDTIVVYDRIRETLRKRRREMYQQVINRGINETLSRTILTAMTTLFVVIALFVLGGGIINDFAFALMVGIIVGTYSSIFIASPILVYWEKLLPSRKR